MYLIIRNQGEVDINAFTLMGASTKDGQDKIGFFGSGNKYALATLLREGYGVKIYSGLKEITLETHPVTLGSQVFEQIFINSLPTSLTTRMGPEWEVWFALREFICNAKDEGGEGQSIGDLPLPIAGVTQVCIEYRDEVEDFVESYKKYIYDEDAIQEVKQGDLNVRIIAKDNPTECMNIYRKGISVIGKNDHMSLFNYDMSKLDINESRIYKYDFQVQQGICTALAGANKDIVTKYLASCKDKSFYESDMSYWGSSSDFSPYWFELLEHTQIYPRGITSRIPAEDLFRSAVLSDSLCEALHEAFPTLAIFGMNNNNGWVVVEPTEEQKNLVNKAVTELETLGFKIGIKIIYGKQMAEDNIALYITTTKECYISVDHIVEEEYDDLVLTLMEENYHSQGYNDGSREFEYELMSQLLTTKRAYKCVVNG